MYAIIDLEIYLFIQVFKHTIYNIDIYLFIHTHIHSLYIYIHGAYASSLPYSITNAV